MSAPYLTGGALGSVELLVTQQSSPNMSVILGPGRAKIPGTSVSPPATQTWTTQAMYDSLNDAPVTLTIAASNPTNPRIDVAYMAVNDSFYSGALNSAVAGIVTGTPAASPVAPAVPSNAVALYYIAVGAGVTSIVNANLSRVVTVARLLGAGGAVADLTALAAVTGASNADQLYVTALKCAFIYSGGVWTQSGIATVANAATRDTEYAKASAAYRVNSATVYLQDAKATQVYNGTVWRGIGSMVPIIPTSVVNGTIAPGGAVTFSAVTSLTLNGAFTVEYDDYYIEIDVSAASGTFLGLIQVRSSGTTETGAVYTYFEYTGSAGGQNFATAATATSYESLRADNPGGGHSDIWVHSPMLAAYTGIFDASWSAIASRDSKATVKTTTAYDGWVLSTVAGTVTVTGTVRIYGYNKN